jgi:hypothetical protein
MRFMRRAEDEANRNRLEQEQLAQVKELQWTIDGIDDDGTRPESRFVLLQFLAVFGVLCCFGRDLERCCAV